MVELIGQKGRALTIDTPTSLATEVVVAVFRKSPGCLTYHTLSKPMISCYVNNVVRILANVLVEFCLEKGFI